MKPSEILAVLSQEQDRARSRIADLGHCSVRLSRATTEFGAFLVDRRSGAMEIRISKHIADEAILRETARHELAHQASYERYGYLGHGALWQNLATYLGCQPVACTNYSVNDEVLAQRQRYEVRCDRCGWSTTRQRRSKLIARPWRFACARCSGALRVALL
jgi:predicted SprT family Zn-dependent metalloprotease